PPSTPFPYTTLFRSGSFRLGVDEREIDVLERGPTHLEALELDASRDGVGGQLLQVAGGSLRADDDLAAVVAVPDLRRLAGTDERSEEHTLNSSHDQI